MQVLQVLQPRHLLLCSRSPAVFDTLKVIEFFATKSLPKRQLPATAVVDTYDILPPLHKDALVHEIKRLRGEVGVLAKRYNSAKREIEDLVKRVRSQPPPPIPKRDEEIEQKIAERHERWVKHLQKEAEKDVEEKAEKQKKQEERVEEEPEEEEEVDSNTVMPTATNEPPEESNTLSPEKPPLDQSPQSVVESRTASRAPSPVSTPPASDIDEDTGMVDVAIEKERVTRIQIYKGDGWGRNMRRESVHEKRRVFEGREKRWKEVCELMSIGENERGVVGDLEEIADRVEEILGLWDEARKRGKYRGWASLRLVDGMFYAKGKLGWYFKLSNDGVEFWE